MNIQKYIVNSLLIGLAVALSHKVTAYSASQGEIRGSNVNVRTASSTDAGVYTQLNDGQAVEIIGVDGDFFSISLDGSVGLYVSDQYLNVVQAVGFITAADANIRQFPSEESEVLRKAFLGDVFDVLGITGEWYMVKLGDETAYIYKDFVEGDLLKYVRTQNVSYEAAVAHSQEPVISTENTYAVINSTNGLNLRELPSTDSRILNTYPHGTAVDVIADFGEWVKVSLNGVEGYVSADYVALKQGERPESDGLKADEIIAYGRQFLGTPYSWGGTNLNKGVDCSGFVYAVMAKNGIQLSRSSSQQVRDGVQISKSNLQKGDLVFFDTSGANNSVISHVGIYIGGGQFIHSSSSRSNGGVTISSLSDDYYARTYVTACRVL